MKLFNRIARRRQQSNPVTFFARQRLGKTMPGEIGALAASRLGFLIG